MRQLALAGLLVGALGLLAGCGQGGGGGGPGDPAVLNQTKSKSELKTRLSDIAKSGVAGSALAGMKESIESLKADDAKLAESLLADLPKLESAQSPAQVKSIATKMAGQL